LGYSFGRVGLAPPFIYKKENQEKEIIHPRTLLAGTLYTQYRRFAYGGIIVRGNVFFWTSRTLREPYSLFSLVRLCTYIPVHLRSLVIYDYNIFRYCHNVSVGGAEELFYLGAVLAG